MKQNNLSLFVLLLCLPCFVYSQGEFLKKGESGVGASIGLVSAQSKASSNSGSDVSIGYSFSRILDIDLGFSQSPPSYGLAITPSISYYLSNDTSKADEIFAIGLIDRYYSSQHTFGLALSLANRLNFNVSTILQPTLSIVLYPSYRGESEIKSVLTVSVGLGIGIRTGYGNIVSITPLLGYQSGVFLLGGSIAFVFNTNPMND
jgi:hypothetical protein